MPQSAGGRPSIVQYWQSGEPPDGVAELVAGFRELNPELDHRLFDEPAAEAFIASSCGDRELAAFRACAVPAMQADYFRYCAVLALGGVYADVGFRCLRPLGPLIESAGGGLLLRKEEPREVIVNGLFVFAAPGHPLLRLALEVATVNIERRVAEQVNMVTGPWIFSALAELRRLGSIEAARARRTRPGVERLAEVMLDAVGSYERVAAAFAGVRIEPLDRVASWIAPAEESLLPYKQGEDRWIGWEARRGSIFR